MERHSEAGTVGAGGEYKAVKITSELQVERGNLSRLCRVLPLYGYHIKHCLTSSVYPAGLDLLFITKSHWMGIRPI